MRQHHAGREGIGSGTPMTDSDALPRRPGHRFDHEAEAHPVVLAHPLTQALRQKPRFFMVCRDPSVRPCGEETESPKEF